MTTVSAARPSRVGLSCLATALLLAAAMPFAAAGETAKPPPLSLKFLSGPPGGGWYLLGEALRAIAAGEGIDLSVDASGGGRSNLVKIAAGEADVGVTLNSFLSAIEVGEKGLPDIKPGRALLLANLYPQPLYFIARREFVEHHAIDSVDTLFAQQGLVRFATQSRTSATTLSLELLLANAFRVGYETLAKQGWTLSFVSYDVAFKGLTEGAIDVFVHGAGPSAPFLDRLVEAKADIVLIPISTDKLELMTHQFMTETFIVRPGTYPFVKQPVALLADRACLVVRHDMDEATAMRLNHLVWAHRGELSTADGSMAFFSPNTAIFGAEQIHPASLKYWPETADKADANKNKAEPPPPGSR